MDIGEGIGGTVSAHKTIRGMVRIAIPRQILFECMAQFMGKGLAIAKGSVPFNVKAVRSVVVTGLDPTT